MKESFNFSKYYHKFESPDGEFTTVRGEGASKEYSIGQEVKIKVNRILIGMAIIGNIERLKIADIPIETLQRDAKHKGSNVVGRQDFINLLNGFRRFNFISSELQFVTLFSLKWRRT